MQGSLHHQRVGEYTAHHHSSLKYSLMMRSPSLRQKDPPRLNNMSSWDIDPKALKKWVEEVLKPRGAMVLQGAGEFSSGSWCRFCKARKQCRKRADGFLELAQMEFKESSHHSDESDKREDLIKISAQTEFMEEE